MKRFFLKSICLLSAVFLAVFSGIQMVDDGLGKIKGKDFPNQISIQEPDSHNLAAKQKKLEEWNNFNVFSFMGKMMTLGISKTAENFLKSITE